MHIKEEAVERHTLAVIVDNEPGILARIGHRIFVHGLPLSADLDSGGFENKLLRVTIQLLQERAPHAKREVVSTPS